MCIRDRHQPEIQQYLAELSPYSTEESGDVIFTPHLLPVNRGILSTIYLHFPEAIPVDKIRSRFSKFATEQKFVQFMDEGNLPDSKVTQNSNRVMIGAESDESGQNWVCLLYTSPSPRDGLLSRMPSSA